MNEMHSQFDKPGWVHSKTEKGIKLECKTNEDDMIAIRITCEDCEMPVEHFLAIMSQVHLMG